MIFTRSFSRRMYAPAAFILLFIAPVINAAADVLIVNTFEDAGDLWAPTGTGIQVAQSQTTLRDGGKSCMKISGASAGTAALASDKNTMPMTSRQFFSVTARVRIDALDPQSADICLKCDFEAAEPGTYLGSGKTNCYDTRRMGTWQRLSGEFRVPYGTERGRFVIGTKSRLPETTGASKNVDICIDNLAIEQIDHYTIDGLYRLDPLPKPLERVRGVHPRMYLTRESIGELKKAVKTTHAGLYREFIDQADGILRHNPPKYMDETEWKNIEQLYMRGVGNNMPFLALAYVLTGEQKYLDGAKTWALAACGYPTWGLHEFANVDLSTGHQLYGLSLVYDWLYNDLDEETRTTIRETMIEKSSYLFDAAAKGIIVKDDEAYRNHPWPEWDEAYLQNHMWINSCGIACAGLAVFDEHGDAARWIAFTLDRYRRTMEILGDDGASHEGPGYWSYGVDWMLKFMHLSRELLGVDMYDHDWWRNTWKYRLYMGLPQNSWRYDNSTVDVGDSRRYDWYGPDYMLRRLAGEFNNGYAQWLANALDDADAEHPVDRWLNLLFYDPAVEARPPGDLPTLWHFTDIDIASARSDWSGDESFVFFKCGPYCGHKAMLEFTYCPSSAHHVHPDTGNFMIFAEGEWLLIDDGYRAKWTEYHNSLLVDNRGQLGGGVPIFNGVEPHGAQSRPRIVTTVSEPQLDHIAGDATVAYPADTGLRRFVRHLLFIKPDVIVVVDDITLDDPKDLELRFHPEQQKAGQVGVTFTTRGEKALFRIEPLTTEGLKVNAETLMALPKGDGEEIPMYTIRLRTHGDRWKSAVAFSWSAAGKRPVDVDLRERGDIWTFTAGTRSVAFDWSTGKASIR